MNNIDQTAAPVYEALMKYKERRVVPFDVPGHKQGRGNKVLRDFLGEACLSVDVNSMKPLDNLCHPISVIKDAEQLAAQAFGASSAFFMVGGTSSAIQAMIMSCCKEGDKIIMPRNVHRSAINSLVLSGVLPVYINPGVHKTLGISLGMQTEDIKKAIEQNPDAKAIFLNNPTYYGICSNLKEIISLAHKAGMLVLADEAHGTHFYFGKDFPLGAITQGADMAAVSMHKTGGSLTQSSILLLGGTKVNYEYVRTIINLTQTTSASYLLISSIDIARRNLALQGEEIFNKVCEFSEYARNEINNLGVYNAFSRELINGDNIYDFDISKLSINTLNTGLAGIEVYDILRDSYDIQIEFGDLSNILAIISVGDTIANIERLVAALSDINRLQSKEKKNMVINEYITPIVELSPKTAFFSDTIEIDINRSIDKISAEFVMCYPPGIPILAPGERITQLALEYILYAKSKGSMLTGPQDLYLNTIKVIKD